MLNKNKMSNERWAIFMSPYLLWKEDCAFMSVMGNRRTRCFEGVNGNFEWIDKSSQFCKFDDVCVQTTAYSVAIRNV